MIAVRTNVYPSHRDTSIWLNYCKLNKEPLQQTSHFLFEVKSCKEIRVILAESFDTLRPSSEIIIGKEMTYSRIRYCNSFPCGNETMSDEETPDVLDCASFKQFWISWKSELSFGQGHVVGEKTIMTKDLRNKINHLGLQTISGNSDQWIVYEGSTWVYLPFHSSEHSLLRTPNMRPLTDDEVKTFFEKLSRYIGENIKLLIDRPDGTYCFRLHKDRVFYVREDLMKLAGNVARKELISLGTCFGKFTASQKFKLHITALDFIAPYAKYKVWLKPNAEQQFVYGNHITKAGLGRITENTPQYQGVIVYNMNDLPLGFGVAAKTTQECRRADPMSIVTFHQADIGEYIRSEEKLL